MGLVDRPASNNAETSQKAKCSCGAKRRKGRQSQRSPRLCSRCQHLGSFVFDSRAVRGKRGKGDINSLDRFASGLASLMVEPLSQLLLPRSHQLLAAYRTRVVGVYQGSGRAWRPVPRPSHARSSGGSPEQRVVSGTGVVFWLMASVCPLQRPLRGRNRRAACSTGSACFGAVARGRTRWFAARSRRRPDAVHAGIFLTGRLRRLSITGTTSAAG